MKDNTLLWLAIAAGVGFWFYQKGYLALVGVCPSGYHIEQNMFPSCVSDQGYIPGADRAVLLQTQAQIVQAQDAWNKLSQDPSYRAAQAAKLAIQ